MHVRTDGSMPAWMDGSMDGGRDGGRDGSTDGWNDRCAILLYTHPYAQVGMCSYIREYYPRYASWFHTGWDLCVCVCTYIYTHTCIHTYTHRDIPTYIHTYIRACRETQKTMFFYQKPFAYVCASKHNGWLWVFTRRDLGMSKYSLVLVASLTLTGAWKATKTCGAKCSFL